MQLELFKYNKKKGSLRVDREKVLHLLDSDSEIMSFLQQNPDCTEIVVSDMDSNDNLIFDERELEILIKANGKLARMNKKLSFSEDHFTLNMCINASVQMNSWAKQINKKEGLSPLEKYAWAYYYVTNYRYNLDPNEKSWRESRSVLSVLNGDHICCAGFAGLLMELCKKIGIECSYVLESVDMGYSGLHATCLVRIDDDKYNVHGMYRADPTSDSLKDLEIDKSKNQEFLRMNKSAKHKKTAPVTSFMQMLLNLDDGFVFGDKTDWAYAIFNKDKDFKVTSVRPAKRCQKRILDAEQGKIGVFPKFEFAKTDCKDQDDLANFRLNYYLYYVDNFFLKKSTFDRRIVRAVSDLQLVSSLQKISKKDFLSFADEIHKYPVNQDIMSAVVDIKQDRLLEIKDLINSDLQTFGDQIDLSRDYIQKIISAEMDYRSQNNGRRKSAKGLCEFEIGVSMLDDDDLFGTENRTQIVDDLAVQLLNDASGQFYWRHKKGEVQFFGERHKSKKIEDYKDSPECQKRICSIEKNLKKIDEALATKTEDFDFLFTTEDGRPVCKTNTSSTRLTSNLICSVLVGSGVDDPKNTVISQDGIVHYCREAQKKYFPPLKIYKAVLAENIKTHLAQNMEGTIEK